MQRPTVTCGPETVDRVVASSPNRVRAIAEREQPELHDLCSDEGEGHEAEHRVDLPAPAEHVDGAARERDHPDEPDGKEDEPWPEEEPAGAVEQHEPHVTPRV